ncbi:MAG: metalloregulator ArsR/SmtB family transcription factor [Burkholderiaceae bacterium]|jgi:DNA-binding transcriptional ArsR family regulator|nr:metalloregulator ArsR/SmtB family transcription factor [Burkholderiaceae bacterium]
MVSNSDRQFLSIGAAQAAAMLRALGNENRLLLLCLLIEHGELNVGQMQEQLDLSQSALSQHLARMRAEGLVDCRREAQTVYYRIIDANVKKIIATLKKIYCP